jgi:3-methyladenine DNA glycosylase AlkD
MGPRYGIHTKKAFGVSMANLKLVAKRLGKSHDLAAELWETGWYDARMLAALIDEPSRVTTLQMDRWANDFDNWGICDTVCFHLFDRTPHALGRVARWNSSKEEFVRRAAFALLASVALHAKHIPDEDLARCLPYIEQAAVDGRNFVKKGVSWALRSIGRRSFSLHAASCALAGRLAESCDPNSRWIGKDVLRDISRPQVRSRLARRAT